MKVRWDLEGWWEERETLRNWVETIGVVMFIVLLIIIVFFVVGSLLAALFGAVDCPAEAYGDCWDPPDPHAI